MRLLDRYLLRELLLPLSYCLIGFLISFIAFDLFSSISELQRDNFSGRDIFQYYVFKTPDFLVTSYVMPMSLLLGLLYAITNHARYNELTAMRAAGIPLWRIALPYVLVGAMFSGILYYVNEQLAPKGLQNAAELRETLADKGSKDAQKVWKRGVFFLNAVDNRTWSIGAFHLRQNVMWNPQFDWRREDGTRLRITAERARWSNRQWVFTNVQQMEFSAAIDALPTITRHEELRMPELTETPRMIKSEIKINAIEGFRSLRKAQLASSEIQDYLRLHPQLEKGKKQSLKTLLYSRLATPWVCLVVVLVAVPFASLPGRRNVFVGVASSVGICFAFFVTKDLTLALGSRGIVQPWMAAWAPNIIFTLTGLVLMWRVR